MLKFQKTDFENRKQEEKNNDKKAKNMKQMGTENQKGETAGECNSFLMFMFSVITNCLFIDKEYNQLRKR